jgi:hypothetical protein
MPAAILDTLERHHRGQWARSLAMPCHGTIPPPLEICLGDDQEYPISLLGATPRNERATPRNYFLLKSQAKHDDKDETKKRQGYWTEPQLLAALLFVTRTLISA